MASKKQTVDVAKYKKQIEKIVPAYNQLCDNYDKLAADVVEMNEKAWSGGKRANDGYKYIASNYERAIKVVDNLRSLIMICDNYIATLDKSVK